MRCVTLMVNRSDRRFQTLSPRMAARGRETDQPNEARGNPSRPGLHLTPDKQAGYMTATEFQIASAIQPLTRAGSIYGWAGAWGIRTLSGDCPVSKISGPLAASRPKWLQDARNGAGGNGESALSSSSAGRPLGGMRADQSFRRQATRLTQRAQFFSNALPIASNAVNCSISNGTLQ